MTVCSNGLARSSEEHGEKVFSGNKFSDLDLSAFMVRVQRNDFLLLFTHVHVHVIINVNLHILIQIIRTDSSVKWTANKNHLAILCTSSFSKKFLWLFFENFQIALHLSVMNYVWLCVFLDIQSWKQFEANVHDKV